MVKLISMAIAIFVISLAFSVYATAQNPAPYTETFQFTEDTDIHFYKTDGTPYSRWTVERGSWTVENGILKNMFGQSHNPLGGLYDYRDTLTLNSPLSVPGSTIRSKVLVTGAPEYRYTVLVIGLQDIDNRYTLTLSPTTDELQLQKVINGVKDPLNLKKKKIGVDKNIWYEMELRWKEKSLEGELFAPNGTSIGTVSLPTAEGWTTGKFGVEGIRDFKAAWFDDITVNSPRKVESIPQPKLFREPTQYEMVETFANNTSKNFNTTTGTPYESKWSVENGRWLVNGGVLKNVYGSGQNSKLGDTLLLKGYQSVAGKSIRANVSSTGTWKYTVLGAGFKDADNNYKLVLSPTTNEMRLDRSIDGKNINTSTKIPLLSGAWYDMELRWAGSRVEGELWDSQGRSIGFVELLSDNSLTGSSFMLEGIRGVNTAQFDNIRIGVLGREYFVTPTPTPTQSPASTPTATVTSTPTPTQSPTITPTIIAGNLPWSGEVSNNIRVAVNDYTIYSDIASDDSWARIIVEDKSGKTQVRKIDKGSTADFDLSGISIGLTSVNATTDEKVISAKIAIASTSIPVSCPHVCVKTWELVNNNCNYNPCGSGCGPDEQTTFSTEAACKLKIQLPQLPVGPSPPYVDLIGDNGFAIISRLNRPTDVVVDLAGNVYVADSGNNKIRKIGIDKIINTIAGTGTPGYSGDESQASRTQLNGPSGLSLIKIGGLYIADTKNSRVRSLFEIWIPELPEYQPGDSIYQGLPSASPEISPTATPSPLNQTPTPTPSPSQSPLPTIILPGFMGTFAGTGEAGHSGYGGLATQAKIGPSRILTVDSSGNVYTGSSGNVYTGLVKINKTTGIITRIDIKGEAGMQPLYLNFNDIEGMAADSKSNLYISDSGNNKIRKIDANGIVTTLAGAGDPLKPATAGFSGDGGPAKDATLNAPTGIALDSLGNVYFADSSNRKIRKIDMITGIISTVFDKVLISQDLASGITRYDVLSNPSGIAFDKNDNLYIADSSNNKIRKLNVKTGEIATIAGTGVAGFGGDNGPAKDALLSYPTDVDIDSDGNVYFSDMSNNMIRVINTDGIIFTRVNSGGIAGFSGDGYFPSSAQLNAPEGISIDSAGNIYIADTQNNRIRVIPSLTLSDTCIDSDSGRNYYVKGSVYEKGPSWTADICNSPDGVGRLNGNQLINSIREGYCENGSMKIEYFDCPNGCKDGVCIQ